MNRPDYTSLIADLSAEYAAHSPLSAALNERASAHLIDGGSHALRLLEPFPPRIAAAQGAWLTDEDGHQILDFWQGHFANILGHNPEVVTSAVAAALTEGFGLQTGFTDRLQAEEVAPDFGVRIGFEIGAQGWTVELAGASCRVRPSLERECDAVLRTGSEEWIGVAAHVVEPTAL